MITITIIITVTLIITRAPKLPPTVNAILLSSDAALNQIYKLIVLFSCKKHTFTSSHKYGCGGSTFNNVRCSHSNRISGLTL